MAETADAVVIGAGFAGASTAWHLARAGAGRVVLLERERAPGRHASGRNAALADVVESDPAMAPLAAEGVRFLEEPPGGFSSVPLLARTGSMRIGARRDLVKLLDASRLEEVTLEEAARRVPILAGARAEAALWSPSGGVVDIHALLGAYLAGLAAAGGSLRCDSPVLKVSRLAGGALEVETPQGRLQARAVVNAAGAWAPEVGARAGAAPLPLTAYRRHLFQSEILPAVSPRWPFVWDESRDLYFRPESGGLLLSPCDAVPHPAAEPAEDPAARELLAEKLTASLPRLADLRLARGWACLRTFAPDSRFVIGGDPQVEGLFWVAGLGGSGVLASAAVGRLAAEAVLGSRRAEGDDGPLSPRRFASGR